jgi:hypothetical protein
MDFRERERERREREREQANSFPKRLLASPARTRINVYTCWTNLSP